MLLARDGFLAVALLSGAALFHSTGASAQAWLGSEGNFSIGLTYSDIYNAKHYLPDGDEIDVGHTRSRSIGIAAVYGLTDQLTVVAHIPYVRAEYEGARPHPTEVDDGTYHGTFTDWHLELHYQALLEPLAVAPYVGFVTPSTSYETLGHAAPGRGLTEYWVGFFVGKSLDDWIARTYVQGRYNYAFVERVAGVAHDRSNVDLEIGYFLTPEWSVRVLLAAQETHGGIDVPIPASNPLFPYHDQIADESYVNGGVGASWSYSERLDVFAVYLTALEGKNGHKLDSGLNLGFSFGLR